MWISLYVVVINTLSFSFANSSRILRNTLKLAREYLLPCTAEASGQIKEEFVSELICYFKLIILLKSF